VILEEAGGRLTDFSGNPFSPYMKQIVATNGKIHGEMISVLAETN
jgi:myo-inositol-1(or 4)-monophosphatase